MAANYLYGVFFNKCPRCRTGNIFLSTKAYNFKTNLKMHKDCPACGQPTEIEVGFYYGTGYVSYAVAVAFSVTTCVLWAIFLGLSFDNNSVIWWFGTNTFLLLITQPLLMRFSRTLWLSWFVKYEPDWKSKPIKQPERIVPEQMNNW